MFDYADHTHWQYLRRARLNVWLMYALFDEPSRAILNFAVPTGVTLGNPKQFSSRFRRSLQYHVAEAATAAFTYSTLRLDNQDMQRLRLLKTVYDMEVENNEAPDTARRIIRADMSEPKGFQRSWLLHGRLRDTGDMEFHAGWHYWPSLRFMVDGVSSTTPEHVVDQVTLQYVGDRASLELQFSSEERLVGGRAVVDGTTAKRAFMRWTYVAYEISMILLRRALKGVRALYRSVVGDRWWRSGQAVAAVEEPYIDTRDKDTLAWPEKLAQQSWRSSWAAGAEFYYTTNNKAGGLSVALRRLSFARQTARWDPPHQGVPMGEMMLNAPTGRYEVLQSCATAIVTPILGQGLLSYAHRINEHLWAAARYDFNVNSFESNLAFGVQLRHGTQSLRVRLDSARGIAFGAQVMLFHERIVASFGFIAPVASLMWLAPFTPSAGLSLQLLS